MAKMRTTGSTTNEPWEDAKPYILKGLQGAGSLYDSKSGFNPYLGASRAPPSELTNRASRLAGQGYQPDKALSDTASGAFLANGNPYFTQRLNQQAGALTDDINRGMSLGGRYGSTAHTAELGNQVGQFRNAGLESDFNRERGMQMQALGQMQEGRQQALGNMFDAGAVQDDYRNSQYADKQRIWEQQQAAPWNRLGAFSNILSGQSSQYGTSTQREPATPWRTALGALIGLGGLFGGRG